MRIGEFSRGACVVLSSFRWLARRGLRAFVLIPLAINVALFTLATVWIVAQAGELAAWLGGALPAWLQWLTWLLLPLLGLAAGLIWFYGFTLVANFVAAPFNGWLAERVTAQAGGPEPPAGRASLPRQIGEAVGGEFAKLLYVLTRGIPLGLLIFVPGLNVVAPLVWFAFGAWLLALEYLDFPLGNRGLGLPEQRALLARRRSLALGFGTAVALLTLLPLVNLVVVPLGVIAASRLAARDLAAPAG